MRAASINSSNLAQTALVFVLNAVALACLAAVLAFWTWRWMLSPPEPPASAAAAAAVGAGRAGGLFGAVGTTNAVAAAAGIRLLGVVAGSGGRTGYAVMQFDGQPVIAVRAGAAIAPGLRLVEVHPRRVILERAGARETLALPSPAAPVPLSPSHEKPMPCDSSRQPCAGTSPT